MGRDMEFVLIRHTRTSARTGTCYGHLDITLAPTHAEDIRAALVNVAPVDAVFSSPLQRCRLLAQVLAQRDGCPLVLENALRELNFGQWEGLTWDNIPRAQSDQWAQNPWDRAPPDGESEQALWDRVRRWYGQLQLLEFNRIAVVGHGGSLRALRCLMLRLAPQHRWEWQIGHGESVQLSYRTERS